METKHCKVCERDLPLDSFYKSGIHKDGKMPKCRECHKNWYLLNREKIIERRRANYIHHSKADFTQASGGTKPCSKCYVLWPANRGYFGQSSKSKDGLSGVCRACKRKDYQRKREYHLQYQREHRDYDSVREWRKRIRSEMLEAYGGQCVCCGESHEEFLQLDHIGGKNEKNHPWNSRHNGTTLYGRIKKMGWPKDLYRLLCANCNWAIRYNQTCPHQRE